VRVLMKMFVMTTTKNGERSIMARDIEAKVIMTIQAKSMVKARVGAKAKATMIIR